MLKISLGLALVAALAGAAGAAPTLKCSYREYANAATQDLSVRLDAASKAPVTARGQYTRVTFKVVKEMKDWPGYYRPSRDEIRDLAREGLTMVFYTVYITPQPDSHQLIIDHQNDYADGGALEVRAFVRDVHLLNMKASLPPHMVTKVSPKLSSLSYSTVTCEVD